MENNIIINNGIDLSFAMGGTGRIPKEKDFIPKPLYKKKKVRKNNMSCAGIYATANGLYLFSDKRSSIIKNGKNVSYNDNFTKIHQINPNLWMILTGIDTKNNISIADFIKNRNPLYFGDIYDIISCELAGLIESNFLILELFPSKFESNINLIVTKKKNNYYSTEVTGPFVFHVKSRFLGDFVRPYIIGENYAVQILSNLKLNNQDTKPNNFKNIITDVLLKLNSLSELTNTNTIEKNMDLYYMDLDFNYEKLI